MVCSNVAMAESSLGEQGGFKQLLFSTKVTKTYGRNRFQLKRGEGSGCGEVFVVDHMGQQETPRDGAQFLSTSSFPGYFGVPFFDPWPAAICAEFFFF